jgi:hypothetical protein
MFKSSGQIAVGRLIEHIDLLSQKSTDTKRDLMIKFVVDAKVHIENNEWGLAMENLLDNIYEIDFKVDSTTIELTKTAFKECQMDYLKFAFIEKLIR